MTELTVPPAGTTTDLRTLGTSATGRGALAATASALLDSGGGVLLTGPAGIGRTTLLSRIAEECAARGYRLLRCSPSPADRHSPYLGLIDLLAGAADEATGELGDHERALLEGALLRAPLPPGADLREGRDPLVLRFAVRKVLALLRRSGPLLLVVDDAQWLDAPTAQILAFLAGRRPGAGHAVLAAQRTGTSPYDPPAPDGESADEAAAGSPGAEAICPGRPASCRCRA